MLVEAMSELKSKRSRGHFEMFNLTFIQNLVSETENSTANRANMQRQIWRWWIVMLGCKGLTLHTLTSV